MAPVGRSHASSSQLYQEPNAWAANAAAPEAASAAGSYVAMLTTFACLGLVVIGWLVARFVQRVRAARRDGGAAGRQKKKASIADSVANAIERAKGVGVWLKSTRYVSRGVSDDQFFKSTKVTASEIQNNPFVIRDDETDAQDVFEVLRRQNALDAQPEQHLAIVICVDEPGSSSKPSVHGDYELLTRMFTTSLCYGGRYKVVGFTSGKTGALPPTSTNLAATLKQLQDANRAWGNIVVCISAPARVYPRDFIDPSLLKNEFADLKAVQHFARRRPTAEQGASSTESTPESHVQMRASDTVSTDAAGDLPLFLGSAGVEILGNRDAPQDTSSWVDLAQLLDRIRFATRRRDGDQPLVCFLDLLMPTGDGNGVDSAISWMQADSLEVTFGDNNSGSTSAPHSAEVAQLQLTRTELLKYFPDTMLLDACKALSVEAAVKQALSQRTALHCLAICCTNASRYATRTRPLSLLGGQKPVYVASVWFGELVRAFHSAQGGLVLSADSTASIKSGTAPLPTVFSSAQDETTVAGLGEEMGQFPSSDVSRLPSACGDVQTSVFHSGLMSVETVVAYLQYYCAELQGMSTVVVHKHSKSASMPLLASVPLATQVMLMPRPIHTLPFLPLAGASHVYDLAIREVLKLLGGVEASVATDAGDEPSVGRYPPHRRTWELFGESTRVPCGKTQFIKALCWHSEVLRQYCNNVLYVDLRDFVRPLSSPAVTAARGPVENAPSAAPSKTLPHDSGLWFVDIVSYLCRLASVSAQLHTVEESCDLLREVFFHPEARYIIVLDHVERADVAEKIRSWVDNEPETEDSGRDDTASSVVLLIRGDAQVRSTNLPSSSGQAPDGTPSSILDTSQSSSHTLVLRVLPPSILAGVAVATCQQNAFDDHVREIRVEVETLLTRLSMSSISGIASVGDNDTAAAAGAAPAGGSMLNTATAISQRNLDVLPLLQFAVRQSLARRSTVCVADWGVDEIVGVCMEALFSPGTAHDVLDAPLPLLDPSTGSVLTRGGHVQSRSSSTAVHDRLRVVQAVLLVPKLFPLNHSARVPLHLVRVVSVLFAELTVPRFISAVMTLIDFGVLLCEHASCGFTSTAKGTLLEDPHAAMLDVGLFLRVNSLIDQSTALTEALRHHLFQSPATVEEREGAQGSNANSRATAALHSVEDLICAAQATLTFETVICAARRAMLSALAPFATKDRARSTAATTNLLFETLQLAGTQTGSGEAQMRSTTLQLTQDVFTKLWFLEAVLDFVSVETLLTALQDLQSNLHCTGAEGTMPSAADTEGPQQGSLLAAKLDIICCALQSHASLIRRNVNELRNVLAACMPELLADLRVSSVLAVEPQDDGTATCAQAYDGSSLFVSRFPSSSPLSVVSEVAVDRADPSSSSTSTPAVTSLLCVAKGVVVAGCSDGSLVVLTIPDESDSTEDAPAKLVLRIDGSDTGHLGEAITDLMVYRCDSDRADAPENDVHATKPQRSPVLISTSRKNRISMEWNSVTQLVAPATPLAKLDASRRIYFPVADSDLAAQKEQETLHRFFVDVFTPITDARYVGDTQFGKHNRRRSGTPVAPSQSAKCECVMLRYGLPDMYRGATFSDTTANSDTNPLAVSHLHGLHQCAATILLPGAPGSVSCVAAAQRHNGTLVVVVGTSSGEIQLLQVVKEQ